MLLRKSAGVPGPLGTGGPIVTDDMAERNDDEPTPEQWVEYLAKDDNPEMAEPTELSQLLELSGKHDLFLIARMKRGLVALIERLKAVEADLEIRSEQLANVQNRLTKERKEHEEQVGREIRVRNTVIAELEAKLAAVEVDHEKDKQAWMTENTELLTQVRSLTAELADMSHTDYLGRTRLDITNDSLAVRKLNGELRKQVKRLTEELKETNAKK